MPMFSIITRHMASRPKSFATMMHSLNMQTFRDFEHVVYVDEVGIGVDQANAMMPQLIERATGDWLWIVDDDDALSIPHALWRVAREIEANPHAPLGESRLGMVMVLGSFGENGILPPEPLRGKKPQRNYVSGQSAIVRRDIARGAAGKWTTKYSSDFDYILACWLSAKYIRHIDEVLISQQRIGNGRPD